MNKESIERAKKNIRVKPNIGSLPNGKKHKLAHQYIIYWQNKLVGYSRPITSQMADNPVISLTSFVNLAEMVEITKQLKELIKNENSRTHKV